MEQELKIVGKCRQWWQLHNKCVMVGLVAVSLVIIAGWIADRSTDGSHYLSTASTVVSIALSLVVIGYAVAQNVRSEIDADKIGRLIERLEQQLHRVEERIIRIQDQTATRINTQMSEDKVGEGEVSFSLSATSHLSRVFAYFLLRSNTLKKPLSIEEFVPIVDPLVKMPTPELKTYVYGILHGMGCCLAGFLKIEEESNVQLSELPRNFADHVKKQAAFLRKLSPNYAKCLDQIDNIQ